MTKLENTFIIPIDTYKPFYIKIENQWMFTIVNEFIGTEQTKLYQKTKYNKKNEILHVTNYYENGNIKEEIDYTVTTINEYFTQFLNYTFCSKENKQIISYHENGKIKSKERFHKDMHIGPQYYYYDNGCMEKYEMFGACEFVKNTWNIESTCLNGTQYYYHDLSTNISNNNLKSILKKTIDYSSGMKCGYETDYNIFGSVIKKVHYTKGVLDTN